MNITDFTYEDIPTCQEFAASNAFMRGLMGPFGSAKSSTCVAEIIQRAKRQARGPDGIRHSRWGIVRNTYGQLRETTIRTVFQWLPPQYYGRYIEGKHTYNIKAIPECDIELQFLALDRPDDIKKLLSLELTGGWVNEAREVPWNVIDGLQGRVGRWPAKRDGGPSWFGVILDTNPPDSDSKFYRFFEEKVWLKDFERMRRDGDLPADMRPEQYAAIFKQPSGLSPHAENLTNLPGGRRYYANLSAGKSVEWVKIYVHGEYGFVAEGKLVYPEYSDQIHCQAVDPVEGVEILRGYDFGLTPACVFSQVLPDGRWLIFDEMTADNMSIDQFGDEVIAHCLRAFRGNATFRDVGDPAGNIRAETDKRTAFDILRAKDIDIVAAVTQDPTLRQEAVRFPLRRLMNGEPQFILHPRCKVLRKGFMGGYHRRRMQTAGPERYSERPEKNEYSHCFPAGVAVLTPQGPKSIESLRVGDLVDTPHGPRAVLATMSRLSSALGTIETAEGVQLPCTPNHPIWTQRGFVRADALKYGDIIARGKAWAAHPSIRSRNSMGFATTEGLAAITKATTRSVANTCIARCGDIITATFRRAMTSITSTRIWSATRSKTRPCSPLLSMQAIMVGNAPWPILQPPRRTWHLSDPKPASGTGPQKGALGIACTLERSLRQLLLLSTPAPAAGAPTRSSAGPVRWDIAPQHAKVLRAGTAESTMRPALAWSATRQSWSTGTARPELAGDVVARANFSAAPEQRVYDLTVADAHCFFANDVLVSNCHDALQYSAVEHFASALVEKPRDPDEGMFADHDDYAIDPTRSSVTGY